MKPSTDREAITLIIDGMLEGGVTLDSVDDGDDVDLIPVKTTEEAANAITAVDIATLYVTLPNGKKSWVWFVQGNDPEEVAADYGVNLEKFIESIVDPWWE